MLQCLSLLVHQTFLLQYNGLFSLEAHHKHFASLNLLLRGVFFSRRIIKKSLDNEDDRHRKSETAFLLLT